MKFNHKILLLPLLTAVAFGLFFLIIWRTTSENGDVFVRVQDEYFHAMELSHSLQVDVMRIRHKLTSAVTTGNTDDVAEAEALVGQVRETFAGCRDVPLLEGRLETLSTIFEGYWQLAGATTRDLLAVNMDQDLDFGSDLLERVGLMNRNYETLVVELADVVQDTNRELEAAINDTRDTVARARRRLNIVSVVFIAGVLGLSLVIIGSIVQPVHRMSRVALAIAGGDLHKELDYRSQDALGELADSFRSMQTALIDDIARRERAEAELIAAQGRIIQSEKMAALGKMVAGLAHEMNTPLGAMASAADTIARGRRIVVDKNAAAASLDELRGDARYGRALTALEGGVGSLGAATARLQELVAGLKAFSVLDQAEYQHHDLNRGLAAARTVLDHEVPAGVELVLEPGDLPAVAGFPALLNQLFLNLMRRALRDVEPPGRVTVRSRPDPAGVVITVSDTGCGHEPEALRAMFDPSFKSDRSRVRLDWELVACAGIVDRHGGTIAAASEPGAGTTYTVTIPLRAEPAEA